MKISKIDVQTVLTNENITVIVYASVGMKPKERIWAWSLPLNRSAMAARLINAVEAGVVFPGTNRMTINGDPHDVIDCRVMGRTMNADLKRLGF